MKLLNGNPPEWEPEPKESKLLRGLRYALLISIVLTMIFLCRGCNSPAWAETIEGHDVQQWATAIGKAEHSKAHPYGIMKKYHHTSPRNACINTVRHVYRNWLNIGQPGAFLPYLASVYAPLNVSNDPNGLNANWQKNVSYFLGKDL